MAPPLGPAMGCRRLTGAGVMGSGGRQSAASGRAQALVRQRRSCASVLDAPPRAVLAACLGCEPVKKRLPSSQALEA